MSQEAAKKKTAQRAAELIEPDMTVGIGSGTTAAIFVGYLAERVRAGLGIRGICSSSASEAAAKRAGIPLTDFNAHPVIDLAVDGADQIGPGLALIKGAGGYLLREKIVISAAKRFVVIGDSTKLVPRIGDGLIPVEVIRMAAPLVAAKLRLLNLEPNIRKDATGEVYITDEGNWILDCRAGHIPDVADLQHRIREITGVVEHGLFLDMADLSIVSDGDAVWQLDRTFSGRHDKLAGNEPIA